MMSAQKRLILQLLNEHRLMTLATVRPDGWPQATMVGYVNDGYFLYCFVARNTRKYSNIQRDFRVSAAIGSDASDPLAIKGLSLGGRAYEVTDQSEFDEVGKLRLKRFPEYAATPTANSGGGPIDRIAARPQRTTSALLRIEPEIISVLNYSKGFGHSDLVTFSARDLDVHISSNENPW